MMHIRCRAPGSATSVTGFALLLAMTGLGCGTDDNSGGGVAAPTTTATRTQTATPTATATPVESREAENLFGSTQVGGGELTVDAAATVDVFFSACFGGTGDTCEGGAILYIGTDPGFKEADTDDPGQPLYHLIDGTAVSLEVVEIDPGVTLVFDQTTLSTAPQSLLLGTTPGIHRDLEWHLLVPGGGGATEDHGVTLRLTTTSGLYTRSAVFRLTLTPAQGEPG